MSEYRDYLKNDNKRIDRKQKRRRCIILICIIALAIVFYLYKEGELDLSAIGIDSWENLEVAETLSSAVDILRSATVGDRELPIYSVDTKENKVALSFDAAWGAEDFKKIMEILDKHKVKVTFFMTGGWVTNNPDCVKTLVEKGHDLGNHSEHHYDMTTISEDEKKSELTQVSEKVKELTGYEMNLFRPPYGAYDNSVIKTAYSLGYFPIQWSVDSLDWKDYGVSSIINTVCNHKELGPGAIILCHNGAKYTAEALDKLLTNIEEKGYKIVPVSELIMKEDYHMDSSGRQVQN